MSENTTPESEQIDVRNNPESRAASADAFSRVSRASDGGAPPRPAPDAGELPEDVDGGARSGNPVAGLEIADDELDDAVVPDTKRPEQEGPTTGHA